MNRIEIKDNTKIAIERNVSFEKWRNYDVFSSEIFQSDRLIDILDIFNIANVIHVNIMPLNGFQRDRIKMAERNECGL